MIARLFADRALRTRMAELEASLDAAERKLGVAQAEIDALAAVIARDRERIKAEGAAYARQRAEAEGVARDEQRHYPRVS